MIPDETVHDELPRWKNAIWGMFQFISKCMPTAFLVACVVEAWRRASLEGEWLFEPMSVEDLIGKFPPK